MKPAPLRGVARGASTLAELTEQLAQSGFRTTLAARPGGVVLCSSCRTEQPAADLAVTAFERLEGASDPAEMAMVVAATCSQCESRGTLVLSYGPEASLDDADVAAALPLELDS